jgi:hypothetical protein
LLLGSRFVRACRERSGPNKTHIGPTEHAARRRAATQEREVLAAPASHTPASARASAEKSLSPYSINNGSQQNTLAWQVLTHTGQAAQRFVIGLASPCRTLNHRLPSVGRLGSWTCRGATAAALLATATMLAPRPAWADWGMVLHTVSHHVDPPAAGRWNERNWGLGLRKKLDETRSLQAGGYRC